MRYFSLIFIFTAQLAWSQTELTTQLRSKVGSDWIKTNPDFQSTSTSYFNSSNIQDFYIAPVNWSGRSIPFFWDCDLSALEFLISKGNAFEHLTGNNADEVYKGTKLLWDNVTATIWVNDEFFDVQLSEWHLMELNECPGTIMFPNVSFTKTFELENAITNSLSGLVFITGELPRTKIVEFEFELTKKDGTLVSGIAIDINDDEIADLFYFIESTDELELESYNRLYANVNGKWQCIYVELYEECV